MVAHGNEYEGRASRQPADHTDLDSVLAARAMALPSFAAAGPFARETGRLLRADQLDAPGRTALASLYLALMSDLRLDDLGCRDDIIVDGPLSGNALYCALLAALRPAQQLMRGNGDTASGTVRGALYLAHPELAHAERAHRNNGRNESPTIAPPGIAPALVAQLAHYRQRWRALLPSRSPT